MASSAGENFAVSGSAFVVTKHSWKGKYRRVLSLSRDGVATHNPSNMDATNSWKLCDLVNVQPVAGGGSASAPTSLVAPSSGTASSALNQTGVQGDQQQQQQEMFQLVYKKGRKTDSMKFSSEWRSVILTEIRCLLDDDRDVPSESSKTWTAFKYHWTEQRVPITLRVGTFALQQLDTITRRVVGTYAFKDIQGLFEVSDYPGGFCLQMGSFGRKHLFASENRNEILLKIVQNSSQFVGVQLERASMSMTFEKFQYSKFGLFSEDLHQTSVSEFVVYKQSEKHNDPVRRILCLTETCLLERDPATYSIVSLHPLSTISALIRHSNHSQLVTFQYNQGWKLRSYTSTDRDSLIASFLDGVRGAGNRDVHVRMSCFERAKRLGPLHIALEEEVESMHLKSIVTLPPGWNFMEAVSRFNANVPYSGLIHSVTAEHLFAENKEKLIHSAMTALISRDCSDSVENTEQLFHALRRLVASKAGYAGFTTIPGFREKVGLAVAKALRLNNDSISHAAIDMLCALMEPMHEEYDLKQEQLNKSSLLSSEKFLDGLLDMWSSHVNRGTGALVVAGMLDFLTFALCSPYSETTDGRQFDTLLEKVADHGRTLYRLFQQPSHTIVKGAGLLMKAIIEEASPETARKMQQLALAEGALPIHLLKALFTKSSDNRLLMHAQLSKHLVGLWTTDFDEADQLLERIFPAGLLRYLKLDDLTPISEEDRLHVRDNLQMAISDAEKNKGHVILRVAGKGLKQAKQVASKTAEVVGEKTHKYTEEAKRLAERHLDTALQHWKTKMGGDEWRKTLMDRYRGSVDSNSSSGNPGSAASNLKANNRNAERPIVLRMRRENLKAVLNWPLFYYQFNLDHSKPDLIWNFKTRQELKDGLENEIQTFGQDRELSGGVLIAWNHTEFSITYNSLAEEIKIGDYFLRLLLTNDDGDADDSPIYRSAEFFSDLYHRFLLTPKAEMKCLCLQAMAIVYGRHHQDIGCFHDTKYIVAMLERTADRVERDRLVMFLDKLMLNKDNVPAVIQSNGIRILLDLLPLAHLHSTRAVLNSMSMAIEANPDTVGGHQEKEWYYGNADKERNGPISFNELKDLFEKKEVTAKTKVWAQGLEGWRLLQQVSQLKWMLMAKGQAVLNESELASKILGIFINLCNYFPSKDEDGAVIRPLPKVKTALSSPSNLPHLVQLLLTFDPILVEKVSSLLYLVLDENPRLSTLYLTGAFFFILMYTGSNLLPIGRFLAATHCRQAFRSEEREKSTTELTERSIVAQMMPEAMVAFLESYGPEKFAQTFLGEYDTPEVIWNHKMRQFMIQKIAYHLADFTPRLKSNVRALYQYCPIPLVSYAALEDELFCDVYYLRNLCDTSKFPNWPISNPLKLLKEVLIAWKFEVEKKPSSMTASHALSILGIQQDATIAANPPEESKIRKAYFRMAQQYHPDKNPHGREMFEKVSGAYEFLCSKASKSGNAPNPDNVVLILRTQSILFMRFSKDLHPYKYAGYPMLIKTIQMETEDNQLFSKSAPLLAAASECAYFTVKCSALNAEELRRENGLEILYQAFERCVAVLSRSSKTDDVAVQVCKHMANFYAVASQFEMCRVKMVEIPGLCKNICSIFYYQHLTSLCADAADCIAALAVDGILQMQMLQAGALWHLLVFMFDYDYTLEEGGVETEAEHSKQAVCNTLAALSVFACSRLAGVLVDEAVASPKNPVVVDCLNAMLTPYVVSKMKHNNPKEVLKILTSNTKNPYIIWDNSTRAELTEFLENERTSTVRRGTCDPAFGAEFRFTSHKDELVVGNIFVRIYNEMPEFPLEEPKRFAIDLLEFLNGEAQYLYSLMSMSNQSQQPTADRIRPSEMALEALSNVLKHNKGVEMQCIGHFKLIFFLLRVESCPKIQEMALKVLNNVTGNRECIDDIAANGVLVNVLRPLYQLTEHQCLSLSIVHSLMNDTRLVKECVHHSGIVPLLYIFCCEKDTDVRKNAAEVLCKMSTDKLMGPKVRIFMSRFLPEIFLDAMKTSAEACIRMYESSQENPELIWNDAARNALSNHLTLLAKQHVVHLRSNLDTPWKVDFDQLSSSVANGGGGGGGGNNLQNELVVSGIYVRLFIANPGWVLRKPREFLVDLLELILQHMSSKNASSSSSSNENLETLTTAFVKLLDAQQPLAEIIPATGYIGRVLTSMSSAGATMQKPAVLILHQLSRSSVCVETMAKCETVAPLKRALKLRDDFMYSICETFNSLFEANHDALVKQALQCGLVNDFLALLDSPLPQVPSPSGCKALIVKALKAMERSLAFGDEVGSLLKQSTVWNQYAAQKHDLFLTDRTTAGYLTSNPGVAGYLTSTQKTTSSVVPPPIDGGSGGNMDTLSPSFDSLI